MRKILAVILSIAMVISFIPTTAFAAYADSGTVFIMTDHFEMGKKYLIVNGNDGDVETLANSKNDLFTTESVIVSNDEITYSGNGLSVWEAKTATNNKIGLFNNGTVLKINAQNSPKITTKEAKYNSGGFEYTQNCHVSYPYSNILYYIGSDNNSFKASKSENDLGMVYIFVEKEGGSSTQSGTGGTVEIEATKTTATEKSATIAVGEKLTIEVSHTSGESKNFTNTISNGEKAEILSGATLTGLSKNAKGSVVVQGLANGSADVTLTGASPSGQGSEYKAIIHLTVVTGGTTPVTPPSDGTVKVGFTSDVHGETANLENWLKILPVKLDNMCFCGDYSYSYDQSEYKSDYDKVVDLTEKYIGTGRGIYTAGNHEYQNGNNLNVYSGIKRLGEAAVSTNAYKVYCLGAYRFDGIGGFQSSDYTALDDYLKGVSPTTPVFILSHFPLHYIQSRTITNAKAVIDVLNKYPNAVFMWGHNHSQNGESHYGEVKSFGDSIKYDSAQSAVISFTYACAGAMNNSQGEYDGCVASVKGDEVTLSYYDADGSQPNIRGKSSSSFKVDISEGSAQQGTDPQPSEDTVTFTKATSIENGKEYIFAGPSGSENKGYLLSTTATNNKFTIDTKPSESTQTITIKKTDAAKVTWTAEGSNRTFSFMNGNQYLEKDTNNGVTFGSSKDNFSISGTQIKSGDKILSYGSNAISDKYLFNFNSNTNSPVFVYVKNGSGGSGGDPAVSESIDLEAVKEGTSSKTATIAVGDELKVNLTHSSQANKDFTIGIDNHNVASVSPSTTTVDVNRTEIITVKGIKEGTATITFTGVNSSEYGGTGGSTYVATLNLTVKGSGDTPGDVTDPTLRSITISSMPTKTTYTSGELFDSSGMTVTALYSDGTYKDVTSAVEYTKEKLTTEIKSVDISYTEGGITRAQSVGVTVNKALLASISITTVPTKTVYTSGESFDKTGMVVTATYEDNSTEPVTGYSVEPSGALKFGDTKVTVSYTEGSVTKTADQTVTVNKAPLAGISITTPPTKTVYTSGDVFDKTGMVVTATYTDNSTETVTNYTVSPSEALMYRNADNTGKMDVTVSYTEGEKTATAKQPVTVNKAALTGIAVTAQPGKKTYTQGDKFDPAEMVVTATYADGSTEPVTGYSVSPAEGLELTDKTVTITYKEGNVEKTATVEITVNEMETVATPVLPEATVFLDGKYITITCDTEDAEIYYTVDGTTPTVDSKKYTGAFLIDKTTTVKTVAVKEGMNNSAIASATYTLGLPFTDVSESDWFYDDVYYVYINGIMEGTGATIFNPNLFTTRAMIVTMLYRLENEPPVGEVNPFHDVANGKWYTNAIKWAYRNLIVEGYTDTMFGPNDVISREQLATILYRYAKYKGYDVSVSEDTNILSFDDADKISAYAVKAMQWAVGEGLINGVTPTTLSPKTGATRAQVAAILHRFCENVKK